MNDPYHSKPGPRPGSGGPAKPKAASSASSPGAPVEKAPPESSGGRVVHDSRGNAVWQWVKDAGRVCIESTSMLLKKLEVPDLKVEDHKQESSELRLEDDVDPGGGYDPYGTKVGSRKSPPAKTPPKKP
jgi:hypothetical protein